MTGEVQMKIEYKGQDGITTVGDYWSVGPNVRLYFDTRWVIAPTGRPVLIGQRRQRNKPVEKEYLQITDELLPGQELHFTSEGDVYVK